MKKRVYIAGKVTGDPNYRRKFEDAARVFQTIGFDTIIPSWIPECLTVEECMQLCFQMICFSDLVVFLPDYKDSKGALLEKQYCEYVGKDYVFLPNNTDKWEVMI